MAAIRENSNTTFRCAMERLGRSDPEDNDVSTHLENAGESQFRGSALEGRVGESGILVALVTDIEGPDDTDYLSLGTWTIAPDNVGDRDNYEYGVFVDGSDPFEQANIQPLQESATYSGLAAGLFIGGPNVSLNTDYGHYAVEDNFDGKLELTANFHSANDLGTISGSITELMVNETLRVGTLNLGETNIGPRDSGFFEGTMSGLISDIGLSGTWGRTVLQQQYNRRKTWKGCWYFRWTICG